MKLNVLVIGSGGREHALCWKLKQSVQLAKLYCAPGNAGIAQHAACVELPTEVDVVNFCKTNNVNFVIIGPEQPLVDGLADTLAANNITCFGPTARAARLEGSKAFMKEICRLQDIPTAVSRHFTQAEAAKAYAREKGFPLVIKADGLAAGKGVVIAQNMDEAERTIDSMLAGDFGEAGKLIVIEEFLEGQEISFFALCDGTRATAFGAAQDHKRAFDGDEGPNTGGMGTYAPPPIWTRVLEEEVMETIIRPTVFGMRSLGCPFTGVLFAGLMITKNGPKLLEYNVRFGDPETQSLMLRLESDLLFLLFACANGALPQAPVLFHDRASVCVVMATKGYPGHYEKGSVIRGLERAVALGQNAVAFHAGTSKKNGELTATGGRVLGICATGATIKDARDSAYTVIEHLDWPEGFCRTDIAWRAIASK